MADKADASSVPPSCSTTVRVRFRPRSSKEGEARCVSFLSDTQIAFTGPDGSRNNFTFDKIYGEPTTQADVFADLRFVVTAALQGYNGTIMAYGQTGSGKTHSLIGAVGHPQHEGVVPRAIGCLAQGIGQAADSEGADFTVSLSVVEIYCERIRDLLDASRDNLAVKSDPTRGVFIEGATELLVTDEQQLNDFMHRGLAQRSVAATSMNETSSRSHCIVTVRVDKSNADGSVQCGKLCMVDLAGSERADRTNAVGATLVEGSLINKSLSCLSNVIYALTDERRPGQPPKHVPYRDSKLTRVLQDSLGGTSRTVLIICCSPCLENAAETLSSLRFGSRAKGVQNTLVVNTRVSPEKLQQQVDELKARNAALAEQLAAALAAAAGPGRSLPPPAPDSSDGGAATPAAAAAATPGCDANGSSLASAAAAAIGGVTCRRCGAESGAAAQTGGSGSRAGGSSCDGSGGGGGASCVVAAVTGRLRDAAEGARLLLGMGGHVMARVGLGTGVSGVGEAGRDQAGKVVGKQRKQGQRVAASGAGGPRGAGKAGAGADASGHVCVPTCVPTRRQAEALVDVAAVALLGLGLAACAVVG